MSPRISIRLLAAQSDARLLALAAEGHERAFEALVHRYRRPLLRYCRRMQLSEARAEDVLQQAFLKAWIALGRGTEVRELQPWLYRIVHNVAVNAMRGPGETHSELTESLQAQAALASESNLDRRIAVRDALGEVAALPQMQRQAIFLTAVDGQTHDEVASVLGISQGALRGLLYRARATLRSAAAAVTPAPLLEWACGSAGTAAPTAERLAELSAGGGAAGLAGLLLKGSVVAVTAGALATGASVVANHDHAGRHLRTHSSAAASATDPSRTSIGELRVESVVLPVATRHRLDVTEMHAGHSYRDRARRRRSSVDRSQPSGHDVAERSLAKSGKELEGSQATESHGGGGHNAQSVRSEQQRGGDGAEEPALQRDVSEAGSDRHGHDGSPDTGTADAARSSEGEQSVPVTGSTDGGGGGKSPPMPSWHARTSPSTRPRPQDATAPA